MSTVAESYLAGLIGDGVTPSLTPPMHEREADAQGLRCIYRPVDLALNGRSPADVGDLVRAGRDLGFNAFNITFPCKQLVSAHLDELSPQAAALGAVNTVVVGPGGRLVGHNTDVTGFGRGLRLALADAPRDRVVQIGTGGAGAAVAHALLDWGVAHLTLVDLDPLRSAERAAALAGTFPRARIDVARPDALPQLVPAADGIVNATPMGMHHHPGAPLDLALLEARHWVADVVYRPLVTPLLAAAAALGCRAMDGGWMAVGQAVDAFELMTGRAPDPDRLRSIFLDLVALEG